MDIANNYSVSDLHHDGDKVACIASAFRDKAQKRIEAIIYGHMEDDGQKSVGEDYKQQIMERFLKVD